MPKFKAVIRQETIHVVIIETELTDIPIVAAAMARELLEKVHANEVDGPYPLADDEKCNAFGIEQANGFHIQSASVQTANTLLETDWPKEKK